MFYQQPKQIVYLQRTNKILFNWISLQTFRYKSWKRRWFILNDNCLYYFEYTTDKEPRGIIPLENILVNWICLEISILIEFNSISCSTNSITVISLKFIRCEKSMIEVSHIVLNCMQVAELILLKRVKLIPKERWVIDVLRTANVCGERISNYCEMFHFIDIVFRVFVGGWRQTFRLPYVCSNRRG